MASGKWLTASLVRNARRVPAVTGSKAEEDSMAGRWSGEGKGSRHRDNQHKIKPLTYDESLLSIARFLSGCDAYRRLGCDNHLFFRTCQTQSQGTRVFKTLTTKNAPGVYLLRRADLPLPS